MKKYIQPNITVVNIEVREHLLTISGTGEQLQGGSNGEYNGDVTLGAKGDWLWSDDEPAEYFED